jgi:hypothetical protein
VTPPARKQGPRGHFRPGDAAGYSRSNGVEEEAEHRYEGQAREHLEHQRRHHPARLHVAEAVEDLAQRRHGDQQRHHQDHEQGRGRQAPLREKPHAKPRKGDLGGLWALAGDLHGGSPT